MIVRTVALLLVLLSVGVLPATKDAVASAAPTRPCEGGVPLPPPPGPTGSAGGNSFYFGHVTKTPPSRPCITEGAKAAPTYHFSEFCFDVARGNAASIDCNPLDCPEGERSVVAYPIEEGRVNYLKPRPRCVGGEVGSPAITPAMILAEIRKVPLPKPALKVQPPGGKTLVNFPTIFSTTATPINRTLTLAGVRVDVRIAPATYVWTFGDPAAPLRTSIPGRPWAKGVTDEEIDRGLAAGFVTHEYVDAHVTVQAHVEVVHAASFSVAGGPWQEVGETVTAVGPAQALRIVEARPVLVG